MYSQHDEYRAGKFEIYGEWYDLVEPDDFDTLVKAIKVKETIENYLGSLGHDEDPNGFDNLLQEQEDYISAYIVSLGEYDNTLLSNNIAFIAKKHGLKIGDIEKMLGISAGYISRTTKEGSGKRLSIDVAWKLARLLGTSINALINTDFSVPTTNTDLLIRFLAKLRKDTRTDKIVWEVEGGFAYDVEQRYIDMNLVAEVNEEESDQDEYTYRYFPKDHLNPRLKWYLSGDIICLKKFNADSDLVMMPLGREGKKGIFGIDCYFVRQEQGTWKWQKVFYSNETPMSKLDDCAKSVYNEIRLMTEFDDKVTPEVKNVIVDYLKGV